MVHHMMAIIQASLGGWARNDFNKQLNRMIVKKPVVVKMDGYFSHMSIELLKMERELGSIQEARPGPWTSSCGSINSPLISCLK